jgi:antitoxin HigA-1
MLLRQFLEPLDLSQNKLARELDVSAPRVNAIINNKRRITPDMALRLSRYFGNSAEFWLNIQQRYDLERTEDEIGAEINRRIAPRSPKELATV